jgi:pimeloyl-ACP methyl ester carboxylesterase
VLAHDRTGAGPPVIALHGWPGDRGDHAALAAALAGEAEVVTPDLLGFGASPAPAGATPADLGAGPQAEAVLTLAADLDLDVPVLVGYDVGSRVAQAAARAHPERVRALVISPPVPGAGQRVLTPEAQREFWYQAFHQLELAERLIDGRPEAARDYLEHFWTHWSGPGWTPPAEHLDRLAEVYGRPGAFTASIAWYRAGSGTVAQSLAERPPDAAERIAVPMTILWPEHDPLFPPAWADRVVEYFADAVVRPVPGCGHFVPVEAPDAMAAAVRERLG